MDLLCTLTFAPCDLLVSTFEQISEQFYNIMHSVKAWQNSSTALGSAAHVTDIIVMTGQNVFAWVLLCVYNNDIITDTSYVSVAFQNVLIQYFFFQNT